jgi:hypothetical protein
MALQTASGVCRVASRILLPTASMAQRLRLFSSRSKQDGFYCSSTHLARVSGARDPACHSFSVAMVERLGNRALALPACSEGSAVILGVFEEIVLSEPQVLTA